MKLSELRMMTTTRIERRHCEMLPDPCPEDDYVVTGESVYDDEFRALVHHRGWGDWRVETGGTSLREDWFHFTSLQEVIDHLEDGGCDS